jgi:hypothetical protein
MNEKNYYNFDNKFIIKKIKIGPFDSKVEMDCKILDFQDIELFNTERGNFQFKTSYIYVEGVGYYYKIELTQKIKISFDINLAIFNKDIKMNSWINLFFVTLENFIFIISSSNKNHKYNISNLKKRKKRMITNIYNNDFIFEAKNNDTKNISSPKLIKSKKFIEMNTLSVSDENLNNNLKNSNNNTYFVEEEALDEEDKIEFDRCFDCNYFWINNIIRDDQKIIKFIKDNTKFKGEDIENLNLNNVYEFFSHENKTIFNSTDKKIKFKIQGYGLDNYARIKNLDTRFSVIVTYLLE